MATVAFHPSLSLVLIKLRLCLTLEQSRPVFWRRKSSFIIVCRKVMRHPQAYAAIKTGPGKCRHPLSGIQYPHCQVSGVFWPCIGYVSLNSSKFLFDGSLVRFQSQAKLSARFICRPIEGLDKGTGPQEMSTCFKT